MSTLLPDDVFTEAELAAYEEGRRAQAEGKSLFDKPYTNRPRSQGDNLDWGWICGFFDGEALVTLEQRKESEKNGGNF